MIRIAVKGRNDIKYVDAPAVSILSKPSETSRQQLSVVSCKRAAGMHSPGSKRTRNEAQSGCSQILSKYLLLSTISSTSDRWMKRSQKCSTSSPIMIPTEKDDSVNSEIMSSLNEIRRLLRSCKWEIDHLEVKCGGSFRAQYITPNPNETIDMIQMLSRNLLQNNS